MAYERHGRAAIEEKLEPAVRVLMAGIEKGSVKRDDPDEVWAHVRDVQDIIDELDAHDAERGRQSMIRSAWKDIERKVLAAHPVIPAEQAAPRCRAADRPGSSYAACSFAGRWTYDGLDEPGCKVHVTKKRDRGVAEVMRAAWNEVDPPAEGETRHPYYAPRPPSIEVVRGVADKLGVTLDAEFLA